MRSRRACQTLPVIAIAGGLGAAVCWAVATLCSSRSSRMIGASSVLAWVMIIGFTVGIIPALAERPGTPAPDGWQIVGLIFVGLSYSAGLLLAYLALSVGRVSIVAPITSTEGAAAAVIAVALGDPISIPTAIVLAVIAAGIVLSSIERSADPPPTSAAGMRTHDPAMNRRAVLLAIGAAAVFSVGLVLSARLGASLPATWILVASRAVGVLVIAVPLALRGRLRLERRAVPLVVVSGILEALGSVLYVVGAQHGVATAAVLSSQFAAIAAVLAYFLFGERLARVQVAGVGVIAVGIGVLAVLRA
ncbi:MAG: eamA-like transporter family protein [Chloroflexi bacterium]|nr:eamA-like transporter family protein [Chloroflexota bacterium]